MQLITMLKKKVLFNYGYIFGLQSEKLNCWKITKFIKLDTRSNEIYGKMERSVCGNYSTRKLSNTNY